MSETFEHAGRTVALTNLDRVLWPAVGMTKRDLVHYYVAVADALVPHLAARPLTLARFPEGVDGPGFLQNECRGRPEWMSVQRLRLRDGRVRTYCVVDDLASLVWVANLGTVELHPYLAHRADDTPTAVVFDLDPGRGRDLVHACQVGLRLREMLSDDGLESVVKTSGAAGLHVYVPLGAGDPFSEARAFSRRFAERLAGQDERMVSASTRPADRAGRVFVDWMQNDSRRSTVAPYSLRAAELPFVSTPVTWREVEDGATGAAPLRFGPGEVRDRLRRHGDLFAPALGRHQRLPAPQGEPWSPGR